jgi:hypothetical protein
VKVEHRGPVTSWFAAPVSDPVEPEYEAAVQESTGRAERDYRRAQDRLARAERRLTAALARQAKASDRKRIAALREAVDLRRAEVEEYRRLMAAAPDASADKQIRLRTGRDDHLELGTYRRPEERRVTPGPVIREFRRDVP